MAWGWSTQKDEKKEEEISIDAGSLTENLTDMANVSAKMQALLDNARNKFEDEYKDVKLRYECHIFFHHRMIDSIFTY